MKRVILILIIALFIGIAVFFIKNKENNVDTNLEPAAIMNNSLSEKIISADEMTKLEEELVEMDKQADEDIKKLYEITGGSEEDFNKKFNKK